jgi:hypothetical protein
MAQIGQLPIRTAAAAAAAAAAGIAASGDKKGPASFIGASMQPREREPHICEQAALADDIVAGCCLQTYSKTPTALDSAETDKTPPCSTEWCLSFHLI